MEVDKFFEGCWLELSIYYTWYKLEFLVSSEFESGYESFKTLNLYDSPWEL